MRNLIYRLFLTAGIFAATFGFVNSVEASIPNAPADTSTTVTVQDYKGKLYFSDVVNESSESQLHAAHYSHQSHSSHSSHMSHYSHVSSRY